MTNGFSAGEREVQERFDSTRLADAIHSKAVHSAFTEADVAFIEARDMFFLATSNADGRLDCSYKGGDPGFVRVLDPTTLVFPHYDGNGMFMSGGNLLEHPRVGMLFIDFSEQRRMRVNGTASVDFGDPLLPSYPGAQFVVRVVPDEVFVNCPRYIHKMELVERSAFVPRAGAETPEAAWKDGLEAVLPAADRTRRAARRTGAVE